MTDLSQVQPQKLDQALAACRAGDFHEVERLCQEIVINCELASEDHKFNALNLLALAQSRLAKYDAALANYGRLIELRPGHAWAYHQRGNVLLDLLRYQEALASYDRAIDLQPDIASVHCNRGNALLDLSRFDEALASYDRALALNPQLAVAHYNRGKALQKLKRFPEAVETYGHAISLQPGFAEAHLNQALSRLLLGDYEEGWKGYEWRMEVASPGNQKRNLAQPMWLGQEDISGKTVFLHAEQGYGDTIQFGRYVPLVAKRCAHLILEVPGSLKSLMATLDGSFQIISQGDPLPHFDFHCPLPSLPMAFGTRIDTIPSSTPYLHVAPEVQRNWDARLGPKQRARVGLVWAGEPTHANDVNRSMSFHLLAPLLDVDATFVSLQKQLRPGDKKILNQNTNIVHCGESLTDFSDTAGLIGNLDLVISVDTSVAHLAGALAKPVWLLLPFIPDWRWLLDRADSPWYPTVRLFRQDATRTWGNVVATVRCALKEFVQSVS
jgi:Tfp pilus assembly protein PilF